MTDTEAGVQEVRLRNIFLCSVHSLLRYIHVFVCMFRVYRYISSWSVRFMVMGMVCVCRCISCLFISLSVWFLFSIIFRVCQYIALHIWGDAINKSFIYIQGGSNMTGTDLYVNKPHCAAAVRLVYIQISPGHIWTTLYITLCNDSNLRRTLKDHDNRHFRSDVVLIRSLVKWCTLGLLYPELNCNLRAYSTYVKFTSRLFSRSGGYERNSNCYRPMRLV